MGRKKAGEVIDLDKRAPSSYAELGRVQMPDDANAELFDEDAEVPQLLPSALQAVLAELGQADDDAKVTVFRLENLAGQRKQVWLTELHPSAFRIQDIQEHYGAGEYQFLVYGKQAGTNYKILHANKRITIGPSLNPKAPLAPLQSSGGVTVNNDSAAIAKTMAEALAPVMATLAGMVQAMQKGSGTRAEMLAEMKELFALAGINNKPQPDLITQLTQAKALADLFSGAKGAALDDESGPWAVLQAAVNQLGAPVGEMLREKIAEKRTAPAPAASLAAPVAAAAPASPPVDNSPQEQDVNALALRLQVGILLNAAKNNMDTGTYADLIFEQAPDEVLAAIAAPDWHARLMEIEPEFAAPPAKAWAERCRAEVMEAMKEEGMLAPPPGAGASQNPTLTVAPPAGKTPQDGSIPPK